MANKINVTEHALMQRVNRTLAKDGKKACKNRSDKWRDTLRNYYVVENNHLVDAYDDIVELARAAGCLKAWEQAEASR
jgi:hypothetical protein